MPSYFFYLLKSSKLYLNDMMVLVDQFVYTNAFFYFSAGISATTGQ